MKEHPSPEEMVPIHHKRWSLI